MRSGRPWRTVLFGKAVRTSRRHRAAATHPLAARHPVRMGAVTAALLLAAAALGGCASARSELGTANSACYISLPQAVTAVHHRGHLYGVRLVSVASLQHRAPLLYRAARRAPGKKVGQVCLVAFTGTFKAKEVERPLGRTAGHLAVVELAYPSKRLLATLLAHHPPLPFGHPHV